MKKIQSNEVHLWVVYDQQVTDANLLQSYQALLNASETSRWQRYQFPQHRHQFLVTRALVRSVLAQYAGVSEPSKLVFEENAYGKPSLSSFPAIQFNLSHTDGLVVLAVTCDNEVGVDVEALSRKAEVLKLAERYFSKQETEGMQALDETLHNERFFNLWTLKEAYIKACGKGLAIPLEDFSFTLTNNEIEIYFSKNLQDSPQYWRFWQFSIESDVRHRLALAVRGESLDEFRLVCRQGVPLQKFEAANFDLSL